MYRTQRYEKVNFNLGIARSLIAYYIAGERMLGEIYRTFAITIVGTLAQSESRGEADFKH